MTYCPIVVDGQEFVPVVVHSPRRRTASVEIKQGKVTVRVPAGTPDLWIQGLIKQRYSWIVRHLSKQLIRQDSYQINPHDSGNVTFRGHEFPVIMRKSKARSAVCFEHECFEVNLNVHTRRPLANVIDELLQQWLVNVAEDYLIPRTFEIAKKIGLYPATVCIGNYKSMWGRCSAKGEIVLNWRLMMADSAAIDYVIIHELCHLEEFNHSPFFWQKVNLHCPHYKQWRNYFKERGVWLRWR